MSHSSGEAWQVLNRTCYSKSNLGHTQVQHAHLLPQALISQRTKTDTRRPFLEITTQQQRPDKEKAQKLHEKKVLCLTEAWNEWEAGYCHPWGHLIPSQDRDPALEGARPALLKVSWMHPGLTQLRASCHLLQLLLISGVPGWAGTTFLGGKAAWGTSQPSQGLGVPWEQCCSCVCWETALKKKKVMRKLQLVHQQQCLVGRNEDISIVLSHNNMV